MDNKYQDIIYMQHPTSAKHPRMSRYARAAQFAPFAALSGHEEAIQETARLTNEKIELSEDAAEELNNKFAILHEYQNASIEITVSYYVKDKRKAGGEYCDYTGIFRKIDDYNKMIVFENNFQIAIEDVINFSGQIFECDI